MTAPVCPRWRRMSGRWSRCAACRVSSVSPVSLPSALSPPPASAPSPLCSIRATVPCLLSACLCLRLPALPPARLPLPPTSGAAARARALSNSYHWVEQLPSHHPFRVVYIP